MSDLGDLLAMGDVITHCRGAVSDLTPYTAEMIVYQPLSRSTVSNEPCYISAVGQRMNFDAETRRCTCAECSVNNSRQCL